MKSDSWISILTNPLGLAAFVLAVVFGAVATKARVNPQMRWAAIGVAALAVVGGLVIDFREHAGGPASQAAAAPGGAVSQSSQGSDSPNVANVQGNVTISHGASR